MEMIKITLECNPADSNIPESMRKDIEEESEWRVGYIMVTEIQSFYPSTKGGTVIQSYNNAYSVKEDVETIRKMINEQKE